MALIRNKKRTGAPVVADAALAGNRCGTDPEHDPEKWVPIYRKDHASEILMRLD
jgi:hypothetical protein